MNERFKTDARPLANPDAVISGRHWRITVLTDGLVRLEWSPDGGFEDRASTFAWYRDQPVPPYDIVDGPDAIEVSTDRFHLRYNREEFSPHGLTVTAKGRLSNHRATWRYGTQPRSLGGTARTLDNVDGRIEPEPGVTSRDGIGVIDDSHSFLFTDDGWIASRSGEGRLDLYVFAYGHDYRGAIQALYSLSGHQPVLPRWALGNWWSRYHRYSEQSYLSLMDRFASEQIPLSVAVIDMDWHRVTSIPEQYGTGWTGYSWEPSLFPDPPRFLDELHRRGLHTTLNVHPHEGIRPFEDAYPAMCAALGRDPELEATITFEPTDPQFFEAYFDVLHRGLEDQGVDFWWIDWQQGRTSSMPGVDPLWMLNHFHFLDSAREGRRPITFSRYAGPGSHRYPVGFSGDTVITWASLQFQPEFTASATDIGYGWWSHDIGGHLWGVRDDDLTVRWMQYGVFSPINRLHSSNNPFLIKEPWLFPLEARSAIAESLRLRNRLIPYLHSMNHRAARQGLPLVSPMYHLHPEDDRAYTHRNQYGFGDQLLVAPITKPLSRSTLMGAVETWLPPGQWVDIFTDAVYEGDTVVEMHRGWSSIPVLAQPGAIVPLTADPMAAAAANPDALELLVVPGRSGSFDLFEDDGSGSTPDDIWAATARTTIDWHQVDSRSASLVIGPASGNTDALPPSRKWTITIIGGPRVESAATGDGRRLEVGSTPGRSSIELDAHDARAGVEVRFEGELVAATSTVNDRCLDILNSAQIEYEAKLAAWRVIETQSSPAVRIAALAGLDIDADVFSALTEILACGA